MGWKVRFVIADCVDARGISRFTFWSKTGELESTYRLGLANVFEAADVYDLWAEFLACVHRIRGSGQVGGVLEEFGKRLC